ncbi:unnamed protein product [Amoebophrya sp. A25]|nr:unnamed protein product [Amoebophrya sp. A25]|eukprot:GSA25T00010231001.1
MPPPKNGRPPAGPRSDFLGWDEYFMGIACLSSFRSKDPRTKVGACIVDPMRRIVGIGYNGFPQGCPDDSLPWTGGEEGEWLSTKYPYVVPAAINAILNSPHNQVENCVLYTTLFPNDECCKMIVQAGISRVVYGDDKYHHRDAWVAARRILDVGGVEVMSLKELLDKDHGKVRPKASSVKTKTPDADLQSGGATSSTSLAKEVMLASGWGIATAIITHVGLTLAQKSGMVAGQSQLMLDMQRALFERTRQTGTSLPFH